MAETNRPMKFDTMRIDVSVFRQIIALLRGGNHVPAEMRDEAASELFMPQTDYQRKQARHYREDHA